MARIEMPGLAEGDVTFLGAWPAPPPAASGTVVLGFLAAKAGLLTLVDWVPGAGCVARTVALVDPMPEHLLASLGGHLLVMSGHESVRLLDLTTGRTRELATRLNPTITNLAGTRLISVASRGLLSMSVWSAGEGEPPFAAGLEPLALSPFDSPSDVLVLPGEGGEEDALALVIGGYGEIGYAAVRGLSTSWPEAEAFTFSSAPLPYDPVDFARPGPVFPTPDWALVYALDQGRSRLLAVNARWSDIIVFPLDVPHAYGVITGVRPSLDATACLVRLRDGRTFFWNPGTAPLLVEFAGTLPLAWQGETCLRWTEDGHGLQEERLHR
ncbi:hypothetical protein EMQ25_10435 [Arsenicitalea aurantiaca]|uniref:WD40 repeat domain-containing protein n=1 Tax=Arsenicitalea aurantiaca TaxID=1783274 RepID=A0A433XB89_9HYPH|nr:hypothetical protein [Arsenicitalea aurantiaca]RUT31268.1 hypothetical protein EMQ25_10435 [Arsenicitalea aurantiaca]